MRVMVVEDDVALALFLRKGLEMDGHTVECVSDGQHAAEQMVDAHPELVVLDLGLPRMDGTDVLRLLHAQLPGASVLVLTGRSETQQRIDCLDMGADDFLVKPFSFHELLARCRAIARRRANSADGILQYGSLVMNRVTREVLLQGSPIELTVKEFSLLEYLLQHRGRCVSRAELLQQVWKNAANAGTNVVDVYINYIRRKLAAAGGEDVVETMRGEGYCIGVRARQAKSRQSSTGLETRSMRTA